MQQLDKITEYLDTVRQQVRWKKAQPIVLDEIQNHITDQKNAFLNDGFDEETATDKAIAEMGDPVVVGEKLNRVHKPKPDWSLLALTVAMLLLGLAIQFFIHSTLGGAWRFERQLVSSGIAIPVMLAAYFFDFTIVGKYPKLAFFALCVITIACLFFTGTVNGRSPSMIYPLLLFPTAFAGFVYSMRNKGYGGLILCGAVFIIPAVLSYYVPSATVLFLLCVSCLAILTGAVLKGWFNIRKRLGILILYIPTAAVLTTPFFIIMGEGYKAKRIQAIFNPSLDPTGAGYMGTIIRRLLSNSQFIGEGFPINGYMPYEAFHILPEINTDFLLTYLIYRLGWIVLIVTIALFAAFIIRAIILCMKQKSVLGFLTSLAIVSTFAVQCIVYIASNLGFLLFSPLSLPLISYGGKILVTNMFLIGLLLSVFRTGALVRDTTGTVAVNLNRFIQYDDGRIIIDLKGNLIK
ncbi:cell division protein FtsW, lipid II flippase [Anaerovirgula multivorans]|uniref:Cell division protein FtsW, lipid II flippase n=1 Tax=Anaerovirgula multivorans TaxID=312168 RepID=A0A239CDR7_9FIRM|nr:FtsW/RodA/SpoVE family cell cycle protein [Anaerovirgula multivorans]SNS18042.1 cell division protein FtsW, lipid II flippase [Anaerovirgula multivorans]